MITMNLMGSFEGYEESKSHPGKFYVYVKPLITPPAGLLRAVKCHKKFGHAEEAVPRIGSFAISCDPEQVPSVGMGEKISMSVICWPISRPVWNERDKNIVHTREISPLYVLDGEIKSTTAKATPATLHIKGYYQGAIRQPDGQIDIRCMIEDTPPVWVLRKQRIEKGNNKYVTGEEVLGMLSIEASAEHLPVMPASTAIEIRGVCYPVCVPYWHEKKENILWKKVPSPVFITTAPIQIEKVKASA